MFEPRLLLIHCSSIPRFKRKHHLGSTFRHHVIHGRGRATTLVENPWLLAFQLMELCLLISSRNYFAFLKASMAFIMGKEPDWAE
jgi:hypothetical protein